MSDWEGHCSWEQKSGVGAKRCTEQCAHCRSLTESRASQPSQYGGLPTAPPGDVGTDQGAVRPDVPLFRWPKIGRRSRRFSR